MSNKTVMVVAGVIVENSTVLLTQRPSGTHLASMWEFPGGKVEEGEDPSEALVRELQEEIGIETRVIDILDVTFWRYPTKNVLLLFYKVERTDPHASVRNVQVADHKWVTLEQLGDFPMPPADGPVLAKVRVLLGTMGSKS